MADSLSAIIADERKRCADLVIKLARGAGKEFLIYCIENAISADEADGFKQRFEEMRDDSVEDLL